MVIPGLPHQNNIQQIGYKLLSMLNFQGEKVAKTLISACLWNDSVEGSVLMQSSYSIYYCKIISDFL